MKHILPAVALGLALVACTPQNGGTSTGSSASSAKASSVSLASAQSADAAGSMAGTSVGASAAASQVQLPASAASSAKPTAQARVVNVVVEDFAFTPSVIKVKKGEKVTLALEGKTGIHGYAVPGLGINARVEADNTVSVTIPTDKTGTFDVFCSIPCGSGHKSMKSTIIIED